MRSPRRTTETRRRFRRKFFDAVRDEATRTAAGSLKDALEKVVRMRDPVTASLTRGDPQALTLLRDAKTLVRGALGYPRPATLG